MIKKLLSFGLILLLFGAIAAGCAAKRMAKQAAQFESAGMFKEAADLYYQSAIKKPGAVEYKVGLNRSGQLYLEEMSAGIALSFNRRDYMKVVYDYIAMQDFAAKVKRAGVNLNIDYSTQQLYESAKDNYLNERYEAGQRLINDQDFEEARKIFTEIHGISPDFRDTRNYLNTATNEPLYQNGTRLFGQKKYMEAYREWDRIASRDPNYKDVKQLMQQALGERYKEGALFLMDENFDAAARALGDVYSINKNYLDVRNLYLEARNEPVYRRAKQSMSAGRCRTAYYNFENILNDAGDYKDAQVLQQEALACAQYPVALYTGNTPKHSTDGTAFESMLIERMLKENNPFVKIHRLDALNSRINRSFSSMSQKMDKSQLSELQNKHGIKAVLMLTFSEYNKSEGKLVKTEKTGFERQPVRATTGEMTYHDRQVTYDEYQKTNTVALTMSYQLISTQTGEILLSRRLNGNEQDNLNYAYYGGENKLLYPASLRNDTYSVDERNYSALQKLLRTDARITPVDQLRDRVFNDLANQVARAVNNFNPEQ
jgi:tetratricopeptide (TPR) repeat protein